MRRQKNVTCENKVTNEVRIFFLRWFLEMCYGACIALPKLTNTEFLYLAYFDCHEDK